MTPQPLSQEELQEIRDLLRDYRGRQPYADTPHTVITHVTKLLAAEAYWRERCYADGEFQDAGSHAEYEAGDEPR